MRGVSGVVGAIALVGVMGAYSRAQATSISVEHPVELAKEAIHHWWPLDSRFHREARRRTLVLWLADILARESTRGTLQGEGVIPGFIAEITRLREKRCVFVAPSPDPSDKLASERIWSAQELEAIHVRIGRHIRDVDQRVDRMNRQLSQIDTLRKVHGIRGRGIARGLYWYVHDKADAELIRSFIQSTSDSWLQDQVPGSNEGQQPRSKAEITRVERWLHTWTELEEVTPERVRQLQRYLDLLKWAYDEVRPPPSHFFGLHCDE